MFAAHSFARILWCHCHLGRLRAACEEAAWGGQMCNRFQVRRHWVIENEGHWLRHLPLGEDAHRDSVPDAVRALPRLRALIINLLGSNASGSIRSGLMAVARGIRRLLVMSWLQL